MSMKWLTGSSSHDPGQRIRRFVAASLCGALIFASGCSLLPKEDEEEILPPITPPVISKKPEYEVTKGTLERTASGTGKLMSAQEETLFFTEDSNNRVKAIHAKVGDKVTAGQLLVELDVESLEKDLRKKKLEFRKQEVTMKETLREKDQMDELDFEQAMIVFEEARQGIVDLENQIAKGKLVAPFAGTLVSLKVEKGGTIKAYDPIATIADTSQLVVTAQISKDDLKNVAVGMEALVDINGVGAVKGKVKALPSVDPDQNNGGGGNQNRPERIEDFLIVQLDKTPEGLNRGTPLSVKIITQRKTDVTLIPLAALRSIGSRTYVQVVDENGKREVDVEVGQQSATHAEIVSGLTPGQKVVGR